LILDGVADEACRVLGQITPLQAAKTPNLDYLAGKGEISHCYTVKEGIAPQSSSAVISLLGYDYNLVARGSLEADGIGIKLARGDLALRANFATIDDLDNGTILDSRAGRTLTNKEANILAKAINEKVKLPFKFDFYPIFQHRAVVVFRGGFSDNITNADPFYGRGTARAGIAPKISFSKPMDEEEDSRLAANLVNSFIRKSHDILDSHPVNVNRARKGFFSANYLLCRDAGNNPVKFKKLKGNWMALGYMPLEQSIARATKMDLCNFSYPKMKGIDVYENLYAGLKKAIKTSVRMMKKNGKKYDVHLKETDVPGHDNKPLEKVKMIELIDKRLFSFLKKFAEKNKTKLVVTSDHTTSCRLKAHSADPVPVMFFNPQAIRHEEQRFTEEQGLKGKKILGRKLLEKTLFAK
jgi:2,3-bisphosphoglycerate-independent phosphoglycerate mutase